MNGSGITADSGANPTGTPHGNDGTVNITSGGTVNVNTAVQTSGNGSGAGSNSIVNLGDASGNSSVTLHGDLVKAGALGANGVLNVGGGSLSADSVLKLYAPGSNGTLNFIANVNLSSGTNAILAANTITIQPAVTVSVQGNGGPPQVFTNNPNYSGFGGTNQNNGTFGGNGANNPLPLNQAPPFDGPPSG